MNCTRPSISGSVPGQPTREARTHGRNSRLTSCRMFCYRPAPRLTNVFSAGRTAKAAVNPGSGITAAYPASKY
ncbi:hypothetical protein E2C01_050743 [Portunus trituberculatus]|uniref:Uncharacterized protein n=1 Tax=Portunus trituberculatus TaxID=210409 RepID=A0A5B7GHS2_PORTR|nr:hypothetical protein [Portunus trituberculatus]